MDACGPPTVTVKALRRMSNALAVTFTLTAAAFPMAFGLTQLLLNSEQAWCFASDTCVCRIHIIYNPKTQHTLGKLLSRHYPNSVWTVLKANGRLELLAAMVYGERFYFHALLIW